MPKPLFFADEVKAGDEKKTHSFRSFSSNELNDIAKNIQKKVIEEMRVIANIYIGLEKSSSGFKLVLEVSDASKLEFAKGALKTALNKLWVDVEQRPRSQKLNKFLEINYTVSLSKDDLINIYASINNPSSSAVALTLD